MLLGIDQGTTGTTVVAYSENLTPMARAYRHINSTHPYPDWVEQDPEQLVSSVQEAVAEVLNKIGGPHKVAAAGLANQGESIVAWDANTLQALSPVIVWSDRRASAVTHKLQGNEPRIRACTGLPLSQYFGAAKIAWLLASDSKLRANHVRFGTLDSWLGLRLGSGSLTDDSTASRTQLYDIRAGCWSEEMLTLFGVPRHALGGIYPSLGDHGSLYDRTWGGSIPFRASLIDQPAALAGIGCHQIGEMKVTYGTGCFVLAHAGQHLPDIERVGGAGLLSSVAWSDSTTKTFALDGGVFSAGSAIDWLVEVGLSDSAAQTSSQALEARDSQAQFVPSLAGLGAPWWRADVTAAFHGLDLFAGRPELVRSVLDAIAFRVADIVTAMARAGVPTAQAIRVDGGLSKNEYLMQKQADLLGVSIEVSLERESTARGAAFLAGVAAGLLGWEDLNRDVERTYEPSISHDQRKSETNRWTQLMETITANSLIDA